MAIKALFVRIAEKITGRKCSRCRWNYKGYCGHPDGNMYMRCWHGITRPGFVSQGKPQNVELTDEEQYQLEKIKSELQRAEDEARLSGLLED